MSGRESCRSEIVRAGELYIRGCQGGRVVDQTTAGRESPGSGGVRTHRMSGSKSGRCQDGWRQVKQSEHRTSIRRYVLIRDYHSRVRWVRRTERTERTERKVLFVLMSNESTHQRGGSRAASPSLPASIHISGTPLCLLLSLRGRP